MEILNKNQRSRAIWRIILLLLLLVTGGVAVIANTHQHYQGQGLDELEQYKKESTERNRALSGENKRLGNELNLAKEKIASLKKQLNAPDEVETLLREQLTEREKKVTELRKEKNDFETALERCQTKVRNLQDF